MNASDWVGSLGVAILLVAFLLILLNKVPKEGMVYLTMNVLGSGLAAIASWMIHYTPFLILELVWMVVSLYGIWMQRRVKKS